ncbi:MAG: hypothetical protein CL840_14505 [Crocinitomicaceae bacterium]|nr:hypothetical protein [Crocinitomicaceae bacterium]|tara:strand:- start:5594 stop:6172 length:579 start_codon:yes stop_codon:yes gene_type:complete
MKKLLTYSAILLAAFTLSLTGCKNKKSTPKKEGEVLLKQYCTGSEYFSNSKYFRANAIGESIDQMTARKKALSNAKASLAGDINTTMKVVSDNYVKSSEFNNKEEVLERFEENARTVVNQSLTGIRTICEEYTKTQEGKFKCYLAIELSGTDIVSKYNERLSKDENLKIDYNYEKFKETFDAEMKKLEDERR